MVHVMLFHSRRTKKIMLKVNKEGMQQNEVYSLGKETFYGFQRKELKSQLWEKENTFLL